MGEAPFLPDEAARLRSFASYDLADPEPLPAVDGLVQLAARLCEAPIAIVTLSGRDQQTFLSSVGLPPEARGTSRELSICAHAIHAGSDLFQVEDTAADARFADLPYASGPDAIRFYAGARLEGDDGHALGTLCVLDRRPRTLSASQAEALKVLSRAVMELLEGRRARRREAVAAALAKQRSADLVAVINAVPDRVAYTDRELKIRFANRAYASMFERTVEDVVGRSLTSLMAPADVQQLMPRVDAALRGEVQTFRGQSVIAGVTEHHRVTLIPDMREGEVFGYVSTVTDVTELEEAFRRSEQRNALLSMTEEMAEIGHWRMRGKGRDLMWSPGVFRIFGVDPATYIPSLDGAIAAVHADDRAAAALAIGRALETKGAFDLESRVVRPDGSTRRVLARGRCEVDPATGELVEMLGVFQDITERSELRERVERQERLVTTGTLAAGVGHEINNPLTYVSANIDFAVDELRTISSRPPAERMREVVEVLVEAREGADRIRKIVRGLRAFAREDTVAVATDVHAAIEISVDMAMHEVRQRAAFELHKGDIRPVFADESRLSQVFVNLLVNAAHAFPDGDTTRNRITVTTRMAAPDRVLVEVTDNGTGMRPAVLARIFDPFFTTKPVGQGTGLGLSICHNVVSALGGEITCSSVLGRGTTFRVVLPVAAEPGAAEHPPHRRGRVLLVDDEESVLRALTRLLAADHEVTAVLDPREALARLVERRERYDVVFCDVMMPELSGIELYRRVMAHDRGVAERFVFVTGGTVYEEIRRFLGEVPNERLEKPFSNQELKAVARRFVELAPKGARA
ncbi:MAG: hybrid sensor histidine kinase/response regulator [Labilithrix sp.]|nr:hybrid sensor histidine kinase/response regulator [Labilithrix sp.]